MSEDFYAALMMRRALPPTTNIKTITEPGIYPVDSGNTNAPVSTAGVLVVLPPTTRPKLKFIAADWNVYTLVGESWQGLGTSAIKDIVTSPTDTTTGRVLTTGWEGLGLAAEFKMGTVSQFLAYSAASAEVPLNGAGWQAAYAPLRRAQAFIGADTKFYSRFSTSADALDSATPWATHYTTLNKPTAADVGALPIAGGTMTGLITTSSDGRGSFASQLGSKAPVYQEINTAATSSEYWPIVKQKYIQGNSAWSMGVLVNAGRLQIYFSAPDNANDKNFSFQTDGQLILPNYANFDARYMGKSNAYTKTESDARYAMSPNVAGFGGVGTYAFLSCNSAVSNGANVAGASLFSSGIAAQKSSSGYGDKSMVIQGSAMAGTWKCLGNQPAPSGNDVGATLYYRIA